MRDPGLRRRVNWILPPLVLALAIAGVGWAVTHPPLPMGPAVRLKEMPASLRAVEAVSGWLGERVRRSAESLPGYDDVLVLGDGRALVSAMDGWLWVVDLERGSAERFLDVPLMPAGLRRAPDDPDLVYFCSAVLHGMRYPAGERVGLYALRLSTRYVEAVVQDVPASVSGEPSRVFVAGAPSTVRGVRPLAFCNDLDVSADGERIYFSEPYAREGASMGEGAATEGIALGRNGRLWLHDRAAGTTRLVASGFHFLDGVLIEPGPGASPEQSILITETTRFRIQRLHVSGPDAGRAEVLWDDLPGTPDGLDRDENGIVWVGLLALRSGMIDWLWAHPRARALLLRVPVSWIPRDGATGVIAFSPDLAAPRFMALHDGSRVRDVSVAVPAGERVYLASFKPDQRGLVWIENPLAAGNRERSALDEFKQVVAGAYTPKTWRRR